MRPSITFLSLSKGSFPESTLSVINAEIRETSCTTGRTCWQRVIISFWHATVSSLTRLFDAWQSSHARYSLTLRTSHSRFSLVRFVIHVLLIRLLLVQFRVSSASLTCDASVWCSTILLFFLLSLVSACLQIPLSLLMPLHKKIVGEFIVSSRSCPA